MGLAVTGEEACVEVLCRLFPADDEARALFARDDLITRLLAAAEPALEFGRACADVAARFPAAGRLLTPASVQERIWQLGYYQLVYALREREDFTYA